MERPRSRDGSASASASTHSPSRRRGHVHGGVAGAPPPGACGLFAALGISAAALAAAPAAIHPLTGGRSTAGYGRAAGPRHRKSLGSEAPRARAHQREHESEMCGVNGARVGSRGIQLGGSAASARSWWVMSLCSRAAGSILGRTLRRRTAADQGPPSGFLPGGVWVRGRDVGVAIPGCDGRTRGSALPAKIGRMW